MSNEIHWSRLGDFDYGDIKAVWEPNRFFFVYTLVRAYAHTDDESIPEMFWRCVEDWAEENPPQSGPNWKCGQEVAIRVLAWTFGLWSFESAPSSTPERKQLLLRLIWVSGNRIESNIGYALDQKSNHGHSEAAGLFTIGTLFPELKRSERWQKQGGELLVKLAEELVYEDGNSCMQSFNYLRAIGDLLLWCSILAEANGGVLRAVVKGRLKAIGELLYQCQDPTTGQVPIYGSNDGALLFPTTSCDYLDFRPLLQTIWVHCQGMRLYPKGPWDEQAFWFRGTLSDVKEVQNRERRDFGVKDSGFYVLRSSKAFAFVRAGRLRHRPSHADQLHVDIWWRGENIACDAGTFSYNNPEPFQNGLKDTAVHNTVCVDGQNQMSKITRFLWVDWATGFSTRFERSEAGVLALWEGWHDGYVRLRSPVIHVRSIIHIGHEDFLIMDRLSSRESHQYTLHWLLADFPHQYATSDVMSSVALEVAGGSFFVTASSEKLLRASLGRAVPNSKRGWRSRYYQQLDPALSLQLEVDAQDALFATHFGPRQVEIHWGDGFLELDNSEWQLRISLAKETNAIVEAAVLSGSMSDHWRADDARAEDSIPAPAF